MVPHLAFVGYSPKDTSHVAQTLPGLVKTFTTLTIQIFECRSERECKKLLLNESQRPGMECLWDLFFGCFNKLAMKSKRWEVEGFFLVGQGEEL